MNLTNCVEQINSERIESLFAALYGPKDYIIESQRQRYIQAVKSFQKYFPAREEVQIYSAPGRTEIGGNHTDHQRGIVLAGAVNLDTIAIVAFHSEGVARVSPIVQSIPTALKRYAEKTMALLLQCWQNTSLITVV